MKILWVSGWAIPVFWFKEVIKKQFPNFEHYCLHPNQQTIKNIEEGQPDVIIGYSLGATILLNTIPRCHQNTQTILLAPFISTIISTTQLKFTQRWLKKDPMAAIRDFYQRAGLDEPKLNTLPYSLDDLIWGIETLINKTSFNNSVNTTIIVGEKDPLINTQKLVKIFPKIQVIPNINHCFDKLIKQLSL